MAATTDSAGTSENTFVTVPGDRRSEVGRTLAEPVPQSLGLLDQFGLWGNLGVSLLGFTGAIFVLQPGGAGTPELSLAAALTAIVAGTLLGTLVLALAGIPGAQTGAPAMVLLRGLFGARVSYLPTVVNVLQLFGWGIFELVTIATAAHTVAPALPRWGYVLIAGGATAALTIRPLGAIRVLRRYATGAVLIVMCYLFVQLLGTRCPPSRTGRGPATGRPPTPWSPSPSRSRRWRPTTRGTRAARGRRSPARWPATRSPRCSATSSGCSRSSPSRAGTPATSSARSSRCRSARSGFAILAARELDQSFADVYSTAVSMQNLRPLWDRRVLAGVITALTTAGALWLNIADYENFLTLLGSVFVPLSAVLIADYFAGYLAVPRRRWDLSAAARSRWPMLAALGGGLRRLPAHQPRVRVLVGVSLVHIRP